MKSPRIHRYQLVKKFLEIQQKELYRKLADLRNQIVKKETSITLFQNYLAEYQEQMSSKTSIDSVNFVNFQLFLDQIAKVLHKENEERDLLQEKNEQLQLEFTKNKTQIDVLEETIVRLVKESKSS